MSTTKVSSLNWLLQVAAAADNFFFIFFLVCVFVAAARRVHSFPTDSPVLHSSPDPIVIGWWTKTKKKTHTLIALNFILANPSQTRRKPVANPSQTRRKPVATPSHQLLRRPCASWDKFSTPRVTAGSVLPLASGVMVTVFIMSVWQTTVMLFPTAEPRPEL